MRVSPPVWSPRYPSMLPSSAIHASDKRSAAASVMMATWPTPPSFAAERMMSPVWKPPLGRESESFHGTSLKPRASIPPRMFPVQKSLISRRPLWPHGTLYVSCKP